jgi:hypothetical protein
MDIEPQYEWIRDYPHGNATNAHAVRRAAYWSLLISPTAGITYGATGVWSWALKQEYPMGHPGHLLEPPWFEAIKYPGSMQRKYLKDLFTSLEWWRLVPAPELLTEQPGKQDPRRFITVARAQGADWALAYIPEGGGISLHVQGMTKPIIGRWFNPRTGRWEGETSIEGKGGTLTAPGSDDWVLWIGPKKR